MDNLDALRAVDGVYRLRLAEERDETDYTDQVALLAVDHPSGTRVVPTSAGELRVVRDAAPAAASHTYDDSTRGRTGLELTFARPRHADSLALVLRGKNSAMAPFMIAQVLSLLGQDVYAFYASAREDSASRAMVGTTMAEMGAIDVQVATAAGWKHVASVMAVGPAIAKSVAVPLDAVDAADESVRVRLEYASGLWELQRVELAADLGIAQARELKVRRAIDQDGRDVTSLVAERDSRYLVTMPGSVVTMEFAAPAVAPGAERTVLSRTTGYYYPHTDDTRPSQLEVVQQIFTDPEYARRYFEKAWRASRR